MFERPFRTHEAIIIAVMGSLAFGAVHKAVRHLPPPPTAVDSGGNMVLGFPRAQIVVAEYASVGCPHCARWERAVYPSFKAKFIDTGRVRFEFHEMLTGDSAMAAAGFLTARCADRQHYFQVVNDVFERQGEIAAKGTPALLAIGERAGLSDDKLNACFNDTTALKALGERTGADAHARGVSGTPTFFVNGVRLDGEQSLASLSVAIAQAKH